MFRRFRFCCATVAGVTLCALSASAAGVTADVTTTPVAYTAATTNTTDLSFNGILQNGTTFQDFTLVTVQGVVFTAQSGSAPVKDEVALSVRLRPETWNRSAQFTELVRSDQSLKTQHDFV